ncbi:MAG TPA: hypothetical protein EYP14_02635 [Planctomycetaceae bacterium]|nr:hypothetical protein [Planctomycetaceae bacterium]
MAAKFRSSQKTVRDICVRRTALRVLCDAHEKRIKSLLTAKFRSSQKTVHNIRVRRTAETNQISDGSNIPSVAKSCPGHSCAAHGRVRLVI